MFPIQKNQVFFTVSRYQHEPNNQVVDFSYGFNLSKDQDYKEVLEALKSRPRLAVFQAWLSPTADEESRQQHISRVAELARLQDERHRGFLIISEPILGREKESSDTLEEMFSGLGYERLGVGMCSDSLVVHNELESQLVTNVHELTTSLKHCSSYEEKKRSTNSMYSIGTSSVFSGVLEILGEKGLMQKRVDEDSTLANYEGRSEERYSEILKTNCQHVARHIRDWIKSEELCDFDLNNHHMLVDCYPFSAQERARRVASLHRDDDGDPHDLADLQDAIRLGHR